MAHVELHKTLKYYAQPSVKRSFFQTLTALGMYLTSITLLMILQHYRFPAWVILLLSLITSPIVVQLFIIFHDCCHASYFKSRRACTWLGHMLGILTCTAYFDWQRTHAIHHRFMANLEKRGVGDIWLMTVDEYRKAGKWTRFCYRLYRHPLVILFISAPFLFIILNRFPSKGSRAREVKSVLFTDCMIALLTIWLVISVGWKALIVIFLPMIMGASMLGVWLFYVQHQFRRVYWAHNSEWDGFRAAMEGSSYYMMPTFFRWLSGNIGYHHIHHLAPRIPNYRLKECFDEVSVLQEIDPVPYLSGLRNLCLSLWDEQEGILVSFGEARAIIKNSERQP